MKVIFLGTNGWYDTDMGNTLCVLLETKDAYIILDAGIGIYKIDRYILKRHKPIYLFLSHIHLDHIMGLHALGKFNFKNGFRIFCPPGIKENLKAIIRKPFTIPFSKLPFKVSLTEISAGKHNNGQLNFTCRRLLHPVPCFGYRFDLENKSIAFCTDTGFCNNAVLLAKNTDLLIAECSYSPNEKVSHWPHLNPKEVATLAKAARAKRLVLVHFDAARYLTKAHRKKAQEIAKQIFRNTLSATDDLKLYI